MLDFLFDLLFDSLPLKWQLGCLTLFLLAIAGLLIWAWSQGWLGS
jgi:hypothetical protein